MVLRSGIIIPFQFRDTKKLLMIGVPEENRNLNIWDLKNVGKPCASDSLMFVVVLVVVGVWVWGWGRCHASVIENKLERERWGQQRTLLLLLLLLLPDGACLPACCLRPRAGR